MKTRLTLKRPLIFIKVQTTGMDSKKDRIIQACFSKLMPDGTEQEGSKLINPGLEISTEITEVNGITNDMLKDKPSFEQIAEGLNSFLKDCDFAGFRIREFDLKFLIEEFNRAGIAFSLIGKHVVDLSVIYHKLYPRDFKEAVKTFLGEEITEKPVTSGLTVKYSREIMEAILTNFSDKEIDGKKITNNIEELNELSIFNYNKKATKSLDNEGYVVLNNSNRPIFTRGKYKDNLVSESLLNDREYYHWIVEKSDFPADTKLIIKRIVQKAKDASELEKTAKV